MDIFTSDTGSTSITTCTNDSFGEENVTYELFVIFEHLVSQLVKTIKHISHVFRINDACFVF